MCPLFSLCGCGQKPNDCQLCRFQNGCLVIFEQCHPLLWSRGILVDHWSTISSWFRKISCHLLTHCGWMMHICAGKLTIIGSDNGLLPGRLQATIWTNAGILLIGPLGTNFSKILIEMNTFSFKKMHLKLSSAKWQPFCLGLNVLRAKPILEVWNQYQNIIN